MVKIHIESTKKIFGIDADRILFCPKKSLAVAKRKLFKQLKNSVISFVVVLVLMIAGALLFFYIEHCYTPTARRIEPHEKAYRDLCGKITLLEGDTIKNTSQNSSIETANNKTDYKHDLADYAIELCTHSKPKDYTRRCELTMSTLAEWFDFTVSIAFTTGFGRVVPYSDIGKGLTVFYAIPSITLGMSLYLSAGHVVTAFTEACVLLFYNNLLKRRLEKNTFSVHVMVCQTLLTFIVWVLFSLVCMYCSFKKITNYVDAFYFAFLTISTVGFGDFSYSSEQGIKAHFLIWFIHAVLFCIGTGAIASLISSINELIANGNIKIPKWCKWCCKSDRGTSVVQADVLTRVKSFRNFGKQNDTGKSDRKKDAGQENPKEIFLSPSTVTQDTRNSNNTSEGGRAAKESSTDKEPDIITTKSTGRK